mgnify:CR=1 FL=1
MKVISFSAIEILPALLNKTKCQTIRPAWKEVCYLKGKCGTKNIKKNGFWMEHKNCKFVLFEKKPRFKTGDIVKLLWNQRSKHLTFCSRCGKGYNYPSMLEVEHTCLPVKENERIPESYSFSKKLGEVEITEVFQIDLNAYDIKRVDKPLYSVTELAQNDGFGTYNKFQNWFIKKYHLDYRFKRFNVYRFRWLKLCKECGRSIINDGYDYDLCLGCHAKSINCEIKVI